MKRTVTFGLTHLAIAVNNLETTLKFYREVFEMQVMYHENKMLQLTTPGCHDILVFEEKKDNPERQSGIDHFGFRLREPSGIMEMRERVIEAGGIIENEGEFVPGSPFIYFRDPDGYLIEVWFEAEG